MAADGNLTSAFANLGNSMVQTDTTAMSQQRAKDVVGVSQAIAGVIQQNQEMVEKSKDYLNKAIRSTMTSASSLSSDELSSVQARTDVLVAEWQKADKNSRLEIEAKIVDLGLKSKTLAAKKLERAELGTNAISNGSIYNNTITGLILDNENSSNRVVTVDDNNNFIYSASGDDKVSINSSDWYNSYEKKSDVPTKTLTSIATNMKGLAVKGIKYTDTDEMNAKDQIINGVIATPNLLAHMQNKARFQNSSGELVTYSQALVDSNKKPSSLFSKALLDLAKNDPSLMKKYDLNDDGFDQKDLDNISAGKLSQLIKDFTVSNDPLDNKENPSYIGFEKAQEVMADMLFDGMKQRDYSNNFEPKADPKQTAKVLQDQKRLNNLKDILSNKDLVGGIQTISSLPNGESADIDRSRGNIYLRKMTKRSVPDPDNEGSFKDEWYVARRLISPQSLMDRMFGASMYRFETLGGGMDFYKTKITQDGEKRTEVNAALGPPDWSKVKTSKNRIKL